MKLVTATAVLLMMTVFLDTTPSVNGRTLPRSKLSMCHLNYMSFLGSDWKKKDIYFCDDKDDAVFIIIQNENADEAKQWCRAQGQPDSQFIENPEKEFHKELKAKYERARYGMSETKSDQPLGKFVCRIDPWRCVYPIEELQRENIEKERHRINKILKDATHPFFKS
eukprot:TCONS_00062987-protein